MKSIKNMKENEHAVSPIVATLVLIVVAVVGAVAVGTIMGTFSSDVSEQNNAGDVASASSTEILVAGSTSTQPAALTIAEEYMDQTPSIKITVQGGGSSAGVASCGLGIVDIGMSSSESAITDAQAGAYPDLKGYMIGGSAVVVIANANTYGTGDNITRAELITLYDTTSGVTDDAASDVDVNTITEVWQRADGSGTEEVFAKYLNLGEDVDDAVDNAQAGQGNAGIIAGVKADDDAIGFVDMGFAVDEDGIVMLDITDGKDYSTTKDNIKNQLKDSSKDTYPDGLTKHLFFMTNGEPNSVVKAFITFAQSPAAHDAITEAGCFSNKDLGYTGNVNL